MSFETLVGRVGKIWVDYTTDACDQIMKGVQQDLTSYLSTKLSVAELEEFRKQCSSSLKKNVANVCDSCVSQQTTSAVQTTTSAPTIVVPKTKPRDDVSSAYKVYTKDELESMTVPVLKGLLSKMKLSKTGTKSHLITRILENQENDEDEDDDASISVSSSSQSEDNGDDDDDDDDEDDDDDDDDEDDEEED